jgi:hypothetical protein
VFDKQAYVRRQEHHLVKWRKKIDELEAVSGNISNAESDRCNRLIANLHLKLKDVEERIVELRNSDDRSAIDLHRDVEEGWTILFRCFSDAAAVIM